VFTIVLFATLRNGSVAWWNLLLWVWLGRVERHKLREEFSQASYASLQFFLVMTCSALLAAWLAQAVALTTGQRDTTYGGAIWTSITFVLIAALINLRDVHKSRMYWFLKLSRESKKQRKQQKWATPMVPVPDGGEIDASRQMSVASDITMESGMLGEGEGEGQAQRDEEGDEEQGSGGGGGGDIELEQSSSSLQSRPSPTQMGAQVPPPPPAEEDRPSAIHRRATSAQFKPGSPPRHPPPPPPQGEEEPPTAIKRRRTTLRTGASMAIGPPKSSPLISKIKATVTVTLTILSSLTVITQVSNASRYPAPGHLVNIGDPSYQWGTQQLYRERYMHLWCAGPHTNPVVLFEHGWMGSSLDWSNVRAKAKETTRVCSFDRAGYGWSDSGPFPRTSFQSVTEVERMLARSEEYVWGAGGRPRNGTFVYAGHSMSGFQMRIFADRNPTLVSGLLMADAVNPDYVVGAGYGNRYPAAVNFLGYLGSWVLAPTIMSLSTSLFPSIMGVADNPSPDLELEHWPYQYAYILSRSRWFETSAEEWVSWPSNAAAVLDCKSLGANATLGDLPTTVLVAEKSAAFNSYVETEELGELSSDSAVVLLEDAEHGFIFDDRYRALIVDELNKLIDRALKRLR